MATTKPRPRFADTSEVMVRAFYRIPAKPRIALGRMPLLKRIAFRAIEARTALSYRQMDTAPKELKQDGSDLNDSTRVIVQTVVRLAENIPSPTICEFGAGRCVNLQALAQRIPRAHFIAVEPTVPPSAMARISGKTTFLRGDDEVFSNFELEPIDVFFSRVTFSMMPPKRVRRAMAKAASVSNKMALYENVSRCFSRSPRVYNGAYIQHAYQRTLEELGWKIDEVIPISDFHPGINGIILASPS